ncbi:MAG TPA: putative porin [Pyrinomonadaceae bacterium]|nr:putative porin [Pyrinomonadaceae bacterium]
MRQFIFRAAVLYALTCALAPCALARQQQQPPPPPAPQEAAPQNVPATEPKLSGSIYGIDEMRRELREQREEIEELRAALKEQSRLMGELRSRVEHTEQLATRTPGATPSAGAVVRDAGYEAGAVPGLPTESAAAAPAQDSKLEERVSKVEKQSAQTSKTTEAVAKQMGSMTFGGDMRFRYESFYGQQNALASAETPGAFGNPLSTRQRLRMRARFSVAGKIGDEFEWGLRLATGSYADNISTNQTLTDFFNRKPFAVDQAFLTYKPKRLQTRHRAFQLQAGKFDTPWTRTELTWDNDISPEGLNEKYTYTFDKKRSIRNVTLVAWQLPLLERNSAFVLGSDGSVDLSASGRAGRDLALYGAQASTEVASKSLSLKLYASDLYFSGTQFITPAQVFGTNIQFPVTFTIPASGTTPARTVTTQVSVPRDLLVSGNANLGLSLANTNAVNRDGRLSSGYNLVDLIARLDYRRVHADNRPTHWPVMLLFNFVTNTQTHDVVTAGPSGADVLLPNREGQGYWAEIRVGRDVVGGRPADLSRGDWMFDYTLTRVEKDAILSPFNGSDLGLSTDMRVNRFVVGYALDPRVAVAFTGFFTQRPTGLLGVFGQTPPGSLNRMLTRLQFDTILRF